jgi:hypothetical protein
MSLQGSFRRLSTPTIVPKGTLELPADLFSASSRSQTEGQRLPDAAMRGLLSASLVASEPLGPSFALWTPGGAINWAVTRPKKALKP